MIQHAVALVFGIGRPAKPGFPAGLAPVRLVGVARLAVRERLPIFAFGNFDCAGLRRRGEVDVGLGAVVDIGYESYAFGSSVEAFGHLLSGKSEPASKKWRMARQGSTATYSSSLGLLLFRAVIGVKAKY